MPAGRQAKQRGLHAHVDAAARSGVDAAGRAHQRAAVAVPAGHALEAAHCKASPHRVASAVGGQVGVCQRLGDGCGWGPSGGGGSRPPGRLNTYARTAHTYSPVNERQLQVQALPVDRWQRLLTGPHCCRPAPAAGSTVAAASAAPWLLLPACADHCSAGCCGCSPGCLCESHSAAVECQCQALVHKRLLQQASSVFYLLQGSKHWPGAAMGPCFKNPSWRLSWQIF